ncbi:MAG TPA: fused MFS/spermidine synthase [Vicinamibacterales bacterium]|nr:fused MFS/spermidine synthase [Vicinamibacterales bacterium]
MRTPTWRISALLLGSGCCALIYQIAWIREFRLIFGASTAASAAVLAIFIGGLGFGGWLLGSRADKHPRPVLFYAQLESVVAVSAALSPLLLMLVRELYVFAGGTPRLGLVAGTVGRLLLSGLVLAIPTIAMGGTLPAAARGATHYGDVRRQDVAALYALNALGAVAGCLVATFFMLEAFGNRQTLWLAAAMNLLIAMLARQLDRSIGPATEATASEPVTTDAQASVPFVLTASGVVGFAFFLMELVWYRMLGPLLGGTVFTFSLILAIALAGIGLGGLVYALAGSNNRAPSLRGFAWSCLLEAGAIAAAYAIGDRLAVLALVLQPLGHAAFAAEVAGWGVVTAIVVLPAAVIAGYQFPMLIALLGHGRQRVGQQIGLAYAANTIGAIAGSLAGGFGLIPWLSAPGAWRFAALSLVVLGAAAMLWSSTRRSVRMLVPQTMLAVATLVLLTGTGPTGVWRHSGIGAGRSTLTAITSANQLKAWKHAELRAVVWDGDGTESSVALKRSLTGYAFFVNGKSDGSARGDAGTQVMSGMLGPILNPRARRSMVIGLGTGSTAGWLGAIPQMERVDVVELEPLILDVARACRDVNRNVMENPKVRITIGDARETLLTTTNTYDVIASEPSNPFRAGVASLFTSEYYRAASNRLTPDGLFIQWIQAYEIDSRTLRTVYATMASAFPYVETWETTANDLMLVGSKHPLVYQVAQLTARIEEEPFKTALRDAWRVVDLAGFFSHYVAGDPLTRAMAAAPDVDLNTDDRNVVEFGLARSVGLNAPALAGALRQLAAGVQAERPPLDNPALVNWAAADTAWVGYRVSEVTLTNTLALVRQDQTEQARREALVSYYQNGNAVAARQALGGTPLAPRDPNELAMLVDLAAQTGSDAAALPLIEQLRAVNAGEAETLLAVLRIQQMRLEDAATALERAFQEYQKNPWAVVQFKQKALELAEALGSGSPTLARRMFDALEPPFAVEAFDEQRLLTRTALARKADFKGLCRDAIGPLESHVPWTAPFLSTRRECYATIGDGRLAQATRDTLEFVSNEPLPLGTGIERSSIARGRE